MFNLSITVDLFSLTLMLLLVGLLWRHRLYYVFPIFFAYCVLTPCHLVIDIALRGYPALFFIAHWLAQGVSVVLAFLAMLSVLRPLADHMYVRHPWLQLLLVPFVALLLLSSLWAAFISPIGRPAIGHFASGIYVFVILMSLAELFLFIVSYRARPSDFRYLRDQVFAILRGFGVLSCLNLVSYTALVLRLLHLRVGPTVESVFQVGPAAAFIAAAMVWLVEFWNPKDLSKPPDLGKMKDAIRVMQEQLNADLEYVKAVARRFGIRLATA